MELSQVLIQHMTHEFDLSAYHDDYESALKDLVNKKIEGQEIAAPAQSQPTNVIDIISALKASLAASEPEKKKSA